MKEVELVETGIEEEYCSECNETCDIVYDCNECDKIACSELCLDNHMSSVHTRANILENRQQCHNCTNVAVISGDFRCPVNSEHIVCSEECSKECHAKHVRESREILSHAGQEQDDIGEITVKNKNLNKASLDYFFESSASQPLKMSDIDTTFQMRDETNKEFVKSIAANFDPKRLDILKFQELENGRYLMIDGYHRFEAMQMLDIDEIPAKHVVIYTATDALSMKMVAFKSNEDRRPWKTSEKIRIVSQLWEEAKQVNGEYSYRQFEDDTGITKSTLERYLSISGMHMHVLGALDNNFSMTAALELKDLSMDEQSILIRNFVENGLRYSTEVIIRLKIWNQSNDYQREQLLDEGWESTIQLYTCSKCSNTMEKHSSIILCGSCDSAEIDALSADDSSKEEFTKHLENNKDVVKMACSKCGIAYQVSEMHMIRHSNNGQAVPTCTPCVDKFNETLEDEEIELYNATLEDEEIELYNATCRFCGEDKETRNWKWSITGEDRIFRDGCDDCKAKTLNKVDIKFEHEKQVLLDLPEFDSPKDQEIKLKTTHRIINTTSEDMSSIESNSVHLIVTSPPYNANKQYSDKDKNADSIPWVDYTSKMQNIVDECFRVLQPGGRMIINVANLMRPRKSDSDARYLPLNILWREFALESGFIELGERIWYKDEAANVTSAWGSYMSPALNHIRDTHEYILTFSKPDEEGNLCSLEKSPESATSHSDLTKEEFLEWTKSVWRIPPAKNTDHPCVYPPELVRRLIKLYSWPGQNVLDIFGGSGTTAAVSEALGRNSISFEIQPQYIPLIEQTIRTGVKQWFHERLTPKGDDN